MAVIYLANEKSFNAEAKTSLLDAAQQAGLVLEHSCRTGRCGSCKAQVLEGETEAIQDESGLSADERQNGWVLTCARGATSDVRLDLADLGLPADIRIKTLPCRIDSLDRLAPDVLKVVLRLPPNADFRYLAGQYIDVIGKGGLRRSYSIANAPVDGAASKIELHIRHVEGGAMSRYWFEEAQANDLLRFDGPRGTFFLRDVAGLNLVLLATGTGIAPIKALLEDLRGRPAEQQPRSVSLYWGGRTLSDLYDDLQAPGLVFIPVLSRADAHWNGARGHVQQVALQASHNNDFDWAQTVVYACGSAAMIEGARASLQLAGLSSKRFFSDAFVSSSVSSSSGQQA